MPEGFLEETNILSFSVQVGGEGMTEGVGVHILVDASFPGQPLDHVPEVSVLDAPTLGA